MIGLTFVLNEKEARSNLKAREIKVISRFFSGSDTDKHGSTVYYYLLDCIIDGEFETTLESDLRKEIKAGVYILKHP